MRSQRFRLTGFVVLSALGIGVPATIADAASAQQAFEISVPKLVAPPSMRGTIDDSWAKAARVSFTYDFTYLRAGDPTTVYVAQDATSLDVAFVATQTQPITANQETNGSGVMSDDAVGIVLWPQGTQGFQYEFVSNARGARDQTSSENSAYSPQWTAVAKWSGQGYVVTMRIPLDIIRTGRSTSWKAQFFRMVVATNSMEVWAHYPGQRNAIDPAYGGTLANMAATADGTSLRPKPRLQVYGLGELTTKTFGGNTSRLGADLAVPVTATSSILGTFHPDYSNLEIDQQTIAPTAYARRYAEVRPFFTQATSNFNYIFSCTNCPQTLYTPAIPTFSDGYAFEGAQGPFTFGFYDAAGRDRSDSGETLNYQVATQKDVYGISVQRLAVDTPQLHDDTTEQSSGYLNQRTHLFAYFNSATDRGTNVTTPGLGDYFEYGGGYVSQLTTVGFTLQKIGEQFNPVDGYVTQTNIAGYSLFFKHTFNFAPSDALRDVSTDEFFGRFHDKSGNPAQTDGSASVRFDLRNLLSLQAYTNSSGVQTGYNGDFLPYNTNGFQLGYKTATTTPTTITYNGGLFDHGRLTAWSYVTTQPIAKHLDLSAEADESLYQPASGFFEPAAHQWLERTSINWQFSRDASLVVGARRIIGRNLPNSFQAPDFSEASPCGTINGTSPFDCVNATNVSFAFHFLSARNEYYVVYGNPNNLMTLPALFLKWIHYIGAEKGT